MNFKNKYLKYKFKYLELKKQIGGSFPPPKQITVKSEFIPNETTVGFEWDNIGFTLNDDIRRKLGSFMNYLLKTCI